MNRTRTRIASITVFAAALALCLSFASSAWAVAGDSIANATDLNDYLGSTITTDLVPEGTGGLGSATGKYYFRQEMTAGQTLQIDVVPSPTVLGLKVLVLPFASGYRIVESTKDASGTVHFSYMATKTGMYNIYFGSSSVGTVTLSPAKVAPVSFKLGSLLAGSKQKANKSFNVSTKIYPRYNGSRMPIKFYIQKKKSGKWRSYASKSGTILVLATPPTTYTKVQASLSLPRGTYRIRAKFADAAHPKAKYNSYKTVYVK